MTTLLSIEVATLEQLIAVLARVSGLLLLAPIIASRAAPRPSRIVLVVVLTAAFFPAAAAAPRLSIDDHLVARLLGEAAVGVAIGLAAELLFAAVDVGAAAVSFGTGLSYMAAVDPISGVRSNALMNFQWLIFSGLFLAVDGHHLLLKALATSFTLVPPGTADLGSFGASLASSTAAVFSFGLALAAPALVVVLILDLAIGMVGRVAPRTHVLLIGIGLEPLAGFVAMALVYGSMPRVLTAALDRLALDIGRMLRAATG